jgi:hypothetical protein
LEVLAGTHTAGGQSGVAARGAMAVGATAAAACGVALEEVLEAADAAVGARATSSGTTHSPGTHRGMDFSSK